MADLGLGNDPPSSAGGTYQQAPRNPNTISQYGTVPTPQAAVATDEVTVDFFCFSFFL
jgi:hypothetical protein